MTYIQVENVWSKMNQNVDYLGKIKYWLKSGNVHNFDFFESEQILIMKGFFSPIEVRIYRFPAKLVGYDPIVFDNK